VAEVSTHRDANLTRGEIRAIVRLIADVWPSPDSSFAQRLQKFTGWVENNRRTGFDVISFIVWADGLAIAHARTFARRIHAESESLTIMALAGVCVAPDRRGEGLGQAVVMKAFERVNKGEFPLGLFQTQIPDFYRKLGCGCVTNRFVNRLNNENPDDNPWWDPHIMIYPGDSAWPDGPIDLNGTAY
jgi:predicted N-acetyltransferase YhbS